MSGGMYNGLQKDQVYFGRAKYVQGGLFVPAAVGKVQQLKVRSDGVVYSKTLIRWTQISAFDVIGLESRFTATRIATLGILAGSLKKSSCYIRIVTARGEDYFEVPGVSEQLVRAWCSGFVPKQLPVANVPGATVTGSPRPTLMARLFPTMSAWGTGGRQP